MDMGDLVGDIAGDVTKGDKARIGPILLFVIEQLIVLAIQWFWHRYGDDPKRAKAEFLNFYQNMNLFRRIQWALKAGKLARQYKNLDSDDELIGATARRLGKLTVDDVESLFSKLQSTVGN